MGTPFAKQVFSVTGYAARPPYFFFFAGLVCFFAAVGSAVGSAVSAVGV